MSRSLKKRRRKALSRLEEIRVNQAIGARAYLDQPGFSIETFRDLCANAYLPVQSVQFGKAVSGDLTSAVMILKSIFPDAEWCIDHTGVDIFVEDEDFEYESDTRQGLAMVKCILDAIIYVCGGVK